MRCSESGRRPGYYTRDDLHTCRLAVMRLLTVTHFACCHLESGAESARYIGHYSAYYLYICASFSHPGDT